MTKIMQQKTYDPLASLILIWIYRVSYLWSVWMTFKMMDITLNDFILLTFPEQRSRWTTLSGILIDVWSIRNAIYCESKTVVIIRDTVSRHDVVEISSWTDIQELINLSWCFFVCSIVSFSRSTVSCKLSDIPAFLYLRNKGWSQIQTSVSLSTSSVSLANATECSEAPRVALRWKNTRPGFSCVIAAWTCHVSASRNVSTSACTYLVIVSSCLSTNKRLTLRPFQSHP